MANCVHLMPVVDEPAWRAFCARILDGDLTEPHRTMLARLGVEREEVYLQETPAGAMLVLVWEGLSPEDGYVAIASMLENPQSDYERYLAQEIVSKVHGLDLTQPPPPPIEYVGGTSV